MREYKVNCVAKLGLGNNHESIAHIGNQEEKWRLSIRSAIRRIEGGGDVFYMLDRRTGIRIPIEIEREPGRPPRLRTRRDGQWTDDLLALPECAPDCRIFW
jgi:hypothetical protein